MSVESRINRAYEALDPNISACPLCRGNPQNVTINDGEPDPPPCASCGQVPFIIEVVRPKKNQEIANEQVKT